LLSGIAQRTQQVEAGGIILLGLEAHALHALLSEGEGREGKVQLEHAGQLGLDALDVVVIHAQLTQAVGIDGLVIQPAAAQYPAADLADLLLVVAEVGQRERDALVDDLEVATARQLLELYECE